MLIRGEQPILEELRAELPDCLIDYEGPWLVVQGAASHHSDQAELNRRVLRWLLDRGADIREVRSGESLEEAYIRTRSDGLGSEKTSL